MQASGEFWSLPGFGQHDVGDFPRGRQIAAHETSGEEAETDRKALGGICDPGRQFAGAGEGGRGLGRAVTARMQHRLAVASLELQPALARGGDVLDLVAFGQRGQQCLRLFDFWKFQRR